MSKERSWRRSTAFRARAEFDIEGEWLVGEDGSRNAKNMVFGSVRIPIESIEAVSPGAKGWDPTELEQISRELRIQASAVMEKIRSEQYRRRVYG